MTRESKQKSLRVELDHQHTPDRMMLWKWRLSALALVAAAGYSSWVTVGSSKSNEAFSPGHVTHVHAGLNHKCSECHADFTPVRRDAWGGGDIANHVVANAKCEHCHQVGFHHASTQLKLPDDGSGSNPVLKEDMCSACHQEHTGLAASLLLVDDTGCVRCHAALPESKEPGQRPVDRFITSFSATGENGHPYFPSLPPVAEQGKPVADGKDYDPGNIKFSHAHHMQAGIPHGNKDDRAKVTLGDIRKADGLAIGRWKLDDTLNDSTAVQLKCDSCHQVQSASGTPTTIDLAARSTPNDFLPITFENHCRACHPLDLDKNDDSGRKMVPHGLQRDELKQAVLGLYNPPPADTNPAKKGTFEKQLLGKPDPLIAADNTTREAEIGKARERLESDTFCAKCHTLQEPNKEDWVRQVVPAHLPTVWLPKAKFDHAAHRTIEVTEKNADGKGEHVQNCRVCHTLPAGIELTSTAGKIAFDDQRVMIANLDTCVKCHSEEAATGTKLPVPEEKDAAAIYTVIAAGNKCVECHNYHHPEKQPKQSSGNRPAQLAEAE